MRRAAFAGALIFLVSCNKSEGGDIGPLTTAKPGSGSSFSAELAKELAGSGKAEAKPGEAQGGDAKAAAAKAGEAKTGAGDKAASDAKAGGTKPDPGAKGAAETKADDAKVAAAAKGDTAKGDAAKGAGDKATSDAKAGGPKADPGAKGAAETKADDAKAAAAAKGDAAKGASDKATSDAKAGAAPAAKIDTDAKGASDAKLRAAGSSGNPAAARGSVKVPAELAAIKLSLLPNWDRDVDEAGTFQYVVRIKGTQNTKTFSFRYGFDDIKAPADREQYKKYLQETGALTGEIKDRQRGGAWFLEGSDAAGLPAFRYVVLYGGKRLICYGSLYKDAESNRLGDDRDQTLIQAKQICETLAL